MNIWKESKKGDDLIMKLKEEYKKFLDDIEKNVKNKEDLQYVKERFLTFFDIVLEEIDYIIKYKEEKIQEIEKEQKSMNDKMSKMQQMMDNIEKDIYSEDGFDFEIVCPYCNYEFVIDVDDNKTEVECPECSNIIELDWSGDPDSEDNNDGGCNGSCSGCSGCGDTDNNEDM